MSLQSKSVAHGEVLGHPRGLFVLFFTEMWERFSYYGMRALLVLYMTDHLILKAQGPSNPIAGFSQLQSFLEYLFGPLAVQPLASQIYGLYTGFVYFTPFFGGLIADRYWGARKSVIVGSILMAIGHFLMAFEAYFLFALVFLILGNGCFKPNISTQVGSLYPEDDPRRDQAFTIFYMGINLGAFFSPLVCGTLGQLYGWHYGFGAAGIGMIVGLLVYLWGQKYLPQEQTKNQKTELVDTPLTWNEWKVVAALVAICILNVVFWAVYEQQGNTIQLFADRNTDWTIAGWQMPSTWFQSLNPMFIFCLTPFINLLWNWQGSKQPSSVGKMTYGCIMLGVSFLVLILPTQGMTAESRIHFLWLVACTLIYTLGELYLSPIGLSLFSKVSPKKLVGMMMGLWFLSAFFGNYLSGYIGTFYETMPRSDFFALLAVLGIASGLAIFAMQKPLRNSLAERKEERSPKPVKQAASATA